MYTVYGGLSVPILRIDMVIRQLGLTNGHITGLVFHRAHYRACNPEGMIIIGLVLASVA